MKRLVLMLASLMLTYVTFAQVANTNNALFQFRNGEQPRDVSMLGTAPEFPFLMRKKSADEVYRTIKKHANDNSEAMNNLNGLLMQIGYANGAKDLQPGDVTEQYLQPGAIRNMGSRGYIYGLYRLQVDAGDLKAWKIAANNGSASGPLLILAKCGNAFYTRKEVRTACVNVPVEVKPDVSQITLPASGSKVTTENKTMVYYARKRHKKDDQSFPVAGLKEEFPSEPLEISESRDANIKPETYTVSVGNTRNDVTACPNKMLDLTANVNVEKTSTYTGNYPADDHITYQEVSKRHYKMIARKKKHAERKANRIAKKTGQDVDLKKA